jgi:hypothetical protein
VLGDLSVGWPFKTTGLRNCVRSTVCMA